MTELSPSHLEDIDMISDSDLFDPAWYVSTYPDVAHLGLTPAAHYVLLGASLLRYPSQHFDPVGYVEAYPEAEGQNPLLHYLKEGRAAGHLKLPNGMIDQSVGSDLRPPSSEDPEAVCYLPDAMKRRADAFRELPWPSKEGPVYRDVRAHFDPVYYIAKYYDLAKSEDTFDLARHYVRAGDKEGRSPSPHFSARAYRKRYKEELKGEPSAYLHWITEGRGKGMIAHPMAEFEDVAKILGMDPGTCQEKLIARKNDVRTRLEYGVLGEMVQKAAAIEPLVGRTWRQAFEPNIQPFHQVRTAQRLVAMSALQEAAEYKRARAVVCVNGPRWGSNRRLEGHVTHALAALYGAEEIIFMSLDREGELPAYKYPEGVRCIDGASVLAPLDDNEKERVMLEFLRSVRPEAVFNVNAALLWKAQNTFGTIMKNDVPVVGCYFCNDKSIYGTWGGYPATQFYRQFSNMKAVCTDSHFLREELIDQFYVPAAHQKRVHVLEAPVNPDLPQVSLEAPGNARPQLFWASRLDLQKRLDVVFEIARLMPHVDIRMWGAAVLGGTDLTKVAPENVIFEGAYEKFDELPLEEADAWLYTSEWDGVPSILLEVAMTGLPIVGSHVGGTGEVLQEDLSWPVTPFDEAGAYVAALEEVLAAPEQAREKAQALRQRLVERRTEAFYEAQVRAVMETVGP